MRFTEDKIKQLIRESIKSVQSAKTDDEKPLRILHKDRSQKFVEELAQKIGALYEGEQGLRIFSKLNPTNKEDFGLNELLFDILVCKVSVVTSKIHGKKLFYIKDALWQVESELAYDSKKALMDFNKLVLGSAQNKLFISSQGRPGTENLFLDILRPAAKACVGNVYVALVPHPSKWGNTVSNVQIWTLKDVSTQKQPVEVRNNRISGVKVDPSTIVQTLLAYRSQQKTGGSLTKNKDADDFLRQNPFAFLMAASIDRGARAEAVWEIPFHLNNKLGHLDPGALFKKDINKLEDILRSLDRKPRYPRQAAQTISSLSNLVTHQFNKNAEVIWKNRKPREVIQTFEQIWGVGPGIAHMTIRILLDEFGYDPGPEGRKQIDVKADIHVIRVFYRTGLISNKSADICIQAARQLHPEFPGLLDWPTWEIGRTWCHEHNPDCNGCPLSNVCQKITT